MENEKLVQGLKLQKAITASSNVIERLNKVNVKDIIGIKLIGNKEDFCFESSQTGSKEISEVDPGATTESIQIAGEIAKMILLGRFKTQLEKLEMQFKSL